MLAKDDSVWRNYVNSIPSVDEGSDAPPMEIFSKRRGPKKYSVQKIVTEVYVWTDMDGQAFNEAVFQQLILLGDMTEAKLKRLLSTEAKRKSGES